MDKDNNYYTLVRARQETPRCVEKECGGCTFRDSSLVYVAVSLVSTSHRFSRLKTVDWIILGTTTVLLYINVNDVALLLV